MPRLLLGVLPLTLIAPSIVQHDTFPATPTWMLMPEEQKAAGPKLAVAAVAPATGIKKP